ncbi:hypothetical protein [Natrinema thermotolerans]
MLEILQQLPIREWNRIKRWWRDTYATVDWPTGPETITLEIDVDVLEEQLRRHHFEGASGWSLKYRGEVLNMRRPAGVAADGTPMEDHLRARPVDGGLEILGHAEANRWEAQEAHVHEAGLTWLNERELRVLLEGCGIDVERLEGG